MKAKKLIVAVTATVALSTAAYQGISNYMVMPIENDMLLMENIEALTQNEATITLPCFPAQTKCVVNAQDLWGNPGQITVENSQKAAPYK